MVSKDSLLPLNLMIFLSLVSLSLALDAINSTTTLRDGDELLSAGGRFKLCFFTPNGATDGRRYLGVLFNKDLSQTVVWVANREKPVNGSSGLLELGSDGRLAVLDGAGVPVWWPKAAGTGGEAVGDPVAELLESGNFVLRASKGGRIIWQSFDEPGDTKLPGMKDWLNIKTGESRHLTAWKSAADPSPGEYCTYRLRGSVLPYSVVMNGSTVRFSTGPLIGTRYSGFTEMNANGIFNTTVAYDGDVLYGVETMIIPSSLVRLVIDPSCTVRYLLWSESRPEWQTLVAAPTDVCDRFANCGPYASCGRESFPVCQCLRGFKPRNPGEWVLGNGTAGCVRVTKLDCGGGDGFLAVRRVKLPYASNVTAAVNVSPEECRERCARDCWCTAFAAAAVGKEDRGCVMWHGDLLDIRTFASAGHDLFVRVAAVDLDPPATSELQNKQREAGRGSAFVVPASVIAGVALLALSGAGCFLLKRKRQTFLLRRKRRIRSRRTRLRLGGGRRKQRRDQASSAGKEDDDQPAELPLFDFDLVAAATDNFSLANKIGEGGFGVVYKGVMGDGEEVAVKRLSWTSSVQGLSEFANEVRLIAKLQHKNLVRLLGCCVHQDERMLIYEYMHNKSLDSFIFDERKRRVLGWRRRVEIISGIARGLLYLHRDSRLTIIHRDLKAGNVLLDRAMNPKISDFGTARIFGADQSVDRTKRVVGTYGYMSPEYAIHGTISVKSDVFSFGVLLLEIVTGSRNRGIYVDTTDDGHPNLLARVWRSWVEGSCCERLPDPVLTAASSSSSCPAPQLLYEDEVLRCIQVGLLCVQERAADRPDMSQVVMMLGTESFPLPPPKRPGFLLLGSTPATTTVDQQHAQSTNACITITDLVDGR